MVSGTILRNVIETEEVEMVTKRVGEMALSPGMLGQMMGLEVGAGDGCGRDGAVAQDCLDTCNGAAVMEEEP